MEKEKDEGRIEEASSQGGGIKVAMLYFLLHVFKHWMC